MCPRHHVPMAESAPEDAFMLRQSESRNWIGAKQSENVDDFADLEHRATESTNDIEHWKADAPPDEPRENTDNQSYRATAQRGSTSSSDSNSTVTTSEPARDNGEQRRTLDDMRRAFSPLTALEFADRSESLQGTSTLSKSPSSLSSSPSSSTSSAGSYGARSEGGSEHDTETSKSSIESVDGDIVSTTFTEKTPFSPIDDFNPINRRLIYSTRGRVSRQRRGSAPSQAHRYGTPEMPRGKANLQHLPPDALSRRLGAPGQSHVKHLPRAEKLPLSGYELLAAKLSSHPTLSRPRSRRPSDASFRGTPSSTREADLALKPIYRRFETLNHRLLLHLQDELSELEEQLHRLDTAETQTRRLQNSILPASRRAEFMAGGELQWHKSDILDKIGYKLGQYSMSSQCVQVISLVMKLTCASQTMYYRHLQQLRVFQLHRR
jgi:hypothetical protein